MRELERDQKHRGAVRATLVTAFLPLDVDHACLRILGAELSLPASPHAV